MKVYAATAVWAAVGLALGCSTFGSGKALRLTTQLSCGMSIQQIAMLTGASGIGFYPDSWRGNYLTSIGKVDLWLSMGDDGLVAYRLSKERVFVAKPPPRVSLRTDLCSGEQSVSVAVMIPPNYRSGMLSVGDGMNVRIEGADTVRLEVPIGAKRIQLQSPGLETLVEDVFADPDSEGTMSVQIGAWAPEEGL